MECDLRILQMTTITFKKGGEKMMKEMVCRAEIQKTMGIFEKMKKIVIVTVVMVMMPAVGGHVYAASSTPYFPDVPDTHWAFNYVQEIYEANITTGFLDGTYRPEANVTRAQMSVFLKKTIDVSKSDADSQIAALKARIEALENLLTHFTRSGNEIMIDGANLHVRSGSGTTFGAVNGLGNIIIGYDEIKILGFNTCSMGEYTDQETCEGNGEVWSLNHKSGSHNLIVGSEHNYSRHSGIVVGRMNQISGELSSVSGGWGNNASGYGSLVSGGAGNTASGESSSVNGGLKNTASGLDSSVSGGHQNTASGNQSSVSGGYIRSASGISDWAAGSLLENQ